MSTAITVIVIVLGGLAGVIMGLRSSAKTGMPPRDVLERATRHSRELETRESAPQRRPGG